jgi:hypothetical protein
MQAAPKPSIELTIHNSTKMRNATRKNAPPVAAESDAVPSQHNQLFLASTVLFEHLYTQLAF